MNQKTKSGSSINSTYKIFLVLTSSLFVMSKAEGFSVLENFFAVTGQPLAAYEKCMERQSNSLSKDAQKMFCKTKYEKEIPRKVIRHNGTARYDGHGKSTRHLAKITNNSSDVIITRVEWVISHEDNKDVYDAILPETCESAKSAVDEPLWIEPHGGKGRMACDVKFIPEVDRRDGPWSWTIKRVYGLKLN